MLNSLLLKRVRSCREAKMLEASTGDRLAASKQNGRSIRYFHGILFRIQQRYGVVLSSQRKTRAISDQFLEIRDRASVGVKSARVTMTARGTIYVTVGTPTSTTAKRFQAKVAMHQPRCPAPSPRSGSFRAGRKQGCRTFPAPLSLLAVLLARDRFSLTEPITCRTIKKPASASLRRSDRFPSILIGFAAESPLGFSGILGQ